MRRHVLSISLLVLALSSGAAPGAWPQALELALRGPRFIAAWKSLGEVVDVNNAVVLRRRVSLDLTNVTADEALKEITRQADLEISYSKALLPSSKSVSLHAREITVAAALTEVLLEAGVDVAVGRGGQMALVARTMAAVSPPEADTGSVRGRVTDQSSGAPLSGVTILIDGTRLSTTTSSDGRYRFVNLVTGVYTVRARYIGYLPATASVTVRGTEETQANFALEKSVQQLDQVVVTGTVAPTQRKALPTPISVVTAEAIRRQGFTRIDQVFRGTVPGAVAWDNGPFDYYSSISIRGASSFTREGIKTFIDGVEVADPQFIATVDPNSIQRVEITRGPQASTLYGSGAIAGVMQIFTKRGQSDRGRPRLSTKIAAGAIDNYDGDGSSLRQDYSLSIDGAGGDYGYSFGGSYVQSGDYVPQYFSRNGSLFAGVRATQDEFTIDASARYATKAFSDPWNPYFRAAGYLPFSQPPNTDDDLKQQTFSLRLAYAPTARWTNQLTFGYDRSRYAFWTTGPRRTEPADTLLSVFETALSKPSVMFNSALEFPLGSSLASTLTAGVDYYQYGSTTSSTFGATRTTGSLDGVTTYDRGDYSNTGYFAQALLGLREALFLTAGIRVESNDNFGPGFGHAVSPRVGLSYVRDISGATAKLRASYGRATQAPFPNQRQEVRNSSQVQLSNPDLGPETQAGWDGGLELYFREQGSIGVTHYDQVASDLIDRVILGADAGVPTIQFQNVGKIRNRGWEFEGKLELGALQVAATYSLAGSEVEGLPSPDQYTGDYQVGDRLLNVPRATAAASVGYTVARTTTVSANITSVGSWKGSDVIALLGAFYGGEPFRGSIRDYWITYPGFTKYGISLTHDFSRLASAFLTIDNLGNTRPFERDNATIPVGRVSVAGVRLVF